LGFWGVGFGFGFLGFGFWGVFCFGVLISRKFDMPRKICEYDFVCVCTIFRNIESKNTALS
jgi:hypothetical protein